MKSVIKAAFAVIAFTVLFSACKKYEDGPAFSLLTKKSRISGDWTVDKYEYNGQDQTSTFLAANGANYVIDIEKDGKYKTTGMFPDEGTWKFGEDKDDVYFMSNKAGATEQAWRITRLKSKQLWMKQTQTNGDVIKLYLKQ